ncbi:uracil phosphoribosyltransferase [Flocculibacter collagenilyticus]|uniref:uracil phosphoribosyltransferase n=1 Tax=Flocculibacter collagenilyticus TaxID=2744479 RepID=UPI001F482E29|nr:uracil phosphoribosyltransferase [Flocculibacter collagenilyticus]
MNQPLLKLNTGILSMFCENAVHVLPQTNQLLSLHLQIRDKTTSQEDFIYYSDQVIRLLLEAGINLLPFRSQSVVTPIGETFEGLELATDVCAVSVIRAGESMETELRSVFAGIPLGKILVQRDKETKLATYSYSNLPEDIASRHVLLLEPMLATGGSAIEALNVLLEHGVKEENIIFINLLASPDGIKRITEAYPKLRIVTSSIEKRMNEHAFMVPGIGDFGDRYFGTQDSGAR